MMAAQGGAKEVHAKQTVAGSANDDIVVTIENGVRTLRMNRPSKKNALSLDVRLKLN